MTKSKDVTSGEQSPRKQTDVTKETQLATRDISSDIVDEGRAMIADGIPTALVETAFALNNLIYAGCENMECAGFIDNLIDSDQSFSDSLEGTFESQSFESKTAETESFDTRSFDTQSCADARSVATDVSSVVPKKNEEKDVVNITIADSSSHTRALGGMMLHVPPLPSISESATEQEGKSYLPGKLASEGAIASEKSIPNSKPATILEETPATDSTTCSPKTGLVESQDKPSKRRGLKKLIRSKKEKDADPLSKQPVNTKATEAKFVSLRAKFDGDDQKYTTATTPSNVTSSNSSSSTKQHSSDSSEKSRKSDMDPSALRRHNSLLDGNKSVKSARSYTRFFMGRSVAGSEFSSETRRKLDNPFSGFSARNRSGKSRPKRDNKKPSLMKRLRSGVKEQPVDVSTNETPIKVEGTSKIVVDTTYKTQSIIPSSTHSTASHSEDDSQQQSSSQKPYVLLAPSDKGQEIALQDDNYYLNDHAAVHSLLTLPTFDGNAGNECNKGVEVSL